MKLQVEAERWPYRTPFRISRDRKSTRLNSSHSQISYAVFCLKKKTQSTHHHTATTTAAHQPAPLRLNLLLASPPTRERHHSDTPINYSPRTSSRPAWPFRRPT